MTKYEKYNPEAGKRAKRAEAEAAELEKDLRLKDPIQVEKPQKAKKEEEDPTPAKAIVTESSARSREWKGDPSKLTRDSLVRNYNDLVGSISVLRNLLDVEEKKEAEAKKLERAASLSNDIVDSFFWTSIEDAKQEEKEAREKRLEEIKEAIDVLTDPEKNFDSMLAKYGTIGWKTICGSYGTLGWLKDSKSKLDTLWQVSETYVKEIVSLKSEVLKLTAKVVGENEIRDAYIKTLQEVREEKSKLYNEVKRLKDAKNEISKAESRADRAESAAEDKIRDALAQMRKVTDELAKYKEAARVAVQAKDEEIKRIGKKVEDAESTYVNIINEGKIRIADLMKQIDKWKDDTAFYKDICDRNNLVCEKPKQDATMVECKEENDGIRQAADRG